MTELIAKKQELIFKSDDPFFNSEAAQKSYELVMKMDEEEARFFTTAVVAELVWENIAKNHRSLQSHLNRVVAKRVEQVTKAVSNTYVSKRMSEEEFDLDEALAAAGALATISKAIRSPYDYGYQFDENKVRRNASGQFTVKIQPTSNKTPMSRRNAEREGIPEPLTRDGAKHLPDERKAQYQNEYRQIATALGIFGADANVTAIVRNKHTGRLDEVRVNGTRAEDVPWHPEYENVVAVHARPADLTVGGASFDVVSALGGYPRSAAYAAGALDQTDKTFGSFAENWTNQASTANSNERTFGRLKSGSEFLGGIAPTGSKTQLAASFGRFVGDHGPEAEKIIGPHARKTAYRYRGTEKEPEREVKQAFGSKMKVSESPEFRAKYRAAQTRALNAAQKKKGSKALTPAERTEIMNAAKKRAGADTSVAAPGRFSARQEVASALMREGQYKRGARSAPRGDLYGLQLASGHLPPSEGVIINRKGEIANQSVGYADDHYLPFNLKHLSSLRGGEYIRTRSVGGPTSEDIYTGLVSGAHALTVKSRSGTFMVEFEDDFTGKRRYNEKAKRMVDRYEKLLDAVESGQVRRAGKEIKPEIRERILAETDADPRNWALSPADKQKARETALEAYRRNPDWTDVDEEWVQTRARAVNMGDPRIPVHVAEKEARDSLKGEKELNFQLNGRGYEDALSALQEQFPYYIKSVRRIPNGADEDKGAVTRDRGYVMPRHNRPTEAQAGYFDTRIAGEHGTRGTGKFSAADADFQNFRYNGERRRAQEANPSDSTENRADITSNPVPAQGEIKEKIQQRLTYADAAAAVLEKLQPSLPADDGLKNVDIQDFKNDMVKNGPLAGEWRDLVGGEGMEEKIFGTPTTDGVIKDPTLIKDYMEASGKLNGSYSDKDRFHAPDVPRSFSEAPYQDGASPELLQAEFTRVNGYAVSHDGMIGTLDDDQLKDEITALGRLTTLRSAAEGQEFLELAKTQGFDPANVGVQRVAAGDANKMAENVHRMRALRQKMEIRNLNTLYLNSPSTGVENAKVHSQNTGRYHRIKQELATARQAADGDDQASEAIDTALADIAVHESGVTIRDEDFDNIRMDVVELKRRHPQYFNGVSA